MRHPRAFAVCVLLVSLLEAVQSVAAPQDQPGSSQARPTPATMANPASANCIQKGGRLVIRKHQDRGEYGICVFDDSHQCEEWAMMRGECPVGGADLAGYVTPAAQYCAIKGGVYTIIGNRGAQNEQGTCTARSGKVCDVWELFGGVCGLNK
jgi:putative hemolysin